jgi:hypothetical protein
MGVRRLTPEEETRYRSIHDLDSFRVLERAQAIVREAGPYRSCSDNIYLWSCERQGYIVVADFLPDFISPDNMSDLILEHLGAYGRKNARYFIDGLLKRLRGMRDQQIKLPQPPGRREG